jgi:hypothetical protein
MCSLLSRLVFYLFRKTFAVSLLSSIPKRRSLNIVFSPSGTTTIQKDGKRWSKWPYKSYTPIKQEKQKKHVGKYKHTPTNGGTWLPSGLVSGLGHWIGDRLENLGGEGAGEVCRCPGKCPKGKDVGREQGWGWSEEKESGARGNTEQGRLKEDGKSDGTRRPLSGTA